MLIQEREGENSMAKLYFRYGAMNCGKSTMILQTAYNYEERDQKVIIIKSSIDTKGGTNIVSRIGLERKVDELVGPSESVIKKTKKYFNKISCILVDEAQFLTGDQVFELFIITKEYDIPVICYGLKADFKTNLFTGSKRLLEVADEFTELPTICRCGKKARFNARKINGRFVFDGDQVAIDEENNVSYESLCGKCYLDKVMHYDKEKNNKVEKSVKK